jgi:hypothetical protein
MLGYRLDIREVIPNRDRVSSCLYFGKIGSGTHQTFYSVATKKPFPRGKVAEAQS